VGPGKNTPYAMILDSICRQNAEFIEAMSVALARSFLQMKVDSMYPALGVALFAKLG
jgi:hypothetical protein